ncbi:MAG: hypothetical protein QG646_1598 [Euryarchaeota archaeon]|nr:hypothetical protein [Euryarchaeota archaeon]
MGINFGLFSGFNVNVGMEALTLGGISFGSISGFDLDGLLSGILG